MISPYDLPQGDRVSAVTGCDACAEARRRRAGSRPPPPQKLLSRYRADGGFVICSRSNSCAGSNLVFPPSVAHTPRTQRHAGHICAHGPLTPWRVCASPSQHRCRGRLERAAGRLASEHAAPPLLAASVHEVRGCPSFVPPLRSLTGSSGGGNTPHWRFDSSALPERSYRHGEAPLLGRESRIPSAVCREDRKSKAGLGDMQGFRSGSGLPECLEAGTCEVCRGWQLPATLAT